MAKRYNFSFVSFSISNTMAPHNDTDYVYFSVATRNVVYGPTYAKIGDLNNGTYTELWSFSDIEIGPSEPFLMHYAIINNGNGDDYTQQHNSYQIYKAITSGLNAALKSASPGHWLSTSQVFDFIKDGLYTEGVDWILSGGNAEGHGYDGLVLQDCVTSKDSDGSALLDYWTDGVEHYEETRNYQGPHDAQYSVTWWVSRSDSYSL